MGQSPGLLGEKGLGGCVEMSPGASNIRISCAEIHKEYYIVGPRARGEEGVFGEPGAGRSEQKSVAWSNGQKTVHMRPAEGAGVTTSVDTSRFLPPDRGTAPST